MGPPAAYPVSVSRRNRRDKKRYTHTFDLVETLYGPKHLDVAAGRRDEVDDDAGADGVRRRDGRRDAVSVLFDRLGQIYIARASGPFPRVDKRCGTHHS